MKKIILYTPSLSTLNLGDKIIFKSILEELNPLINGNFIVKISTHLPLSNMYLRYLKDADIRFVCGSNLLDSKQNARFKQWYVKLSNIKLIGPCILIGVGWRQYEKSANIYTRLLYKYILSQEYYHSVRDSYTLNKLNEIGILNVINTGCPSMWSLTPEHCANIPSSKANRVICTLTDYNIDMERDKKFLNILLNNYKEVYFWVQGYNDLSYLKMLSYENRLKIVPPSIKALENLLEEDDIEYVGTRLHAGLMALKKQKRSIIIAVDNRALEKQKDFNIIAIKREMIEDLERLLNSKIKINISIPVNNIKKWKKQFGII